MSTTTHPSSTPPSFDAAKRTVLVTGATGFIGRHLVTALLADGHAVIALARQPQAAAKSFDARVRCIGAMELLPNDCAVDVVVNLAGAPILGPRWTDERLHTLRASRIGLTGDVVRWIAKAQRKPSLMLSGSAIGYYGIQPIGDDTRLDEHAPPQPILMSDLCREWEGAAYAAAEHGVRVECMRFGVVLGQGGGALSKLLLPIKLGIGGRLGSGRQWMSWIHIEDVMGAMAHRWRDALGPDGASASPAARTGATNFTAPEAIHQATFSEVAARLWHRPSIVPTPAWPIRLMLGEQADLLLEGQRVAPRRLEREGYAFRHPDLEGALRSLK